MILLAEVQTVVVLKASGHWAVLNTSYFSGGCIACQSHPSGSVSTISKLWKVVVAQKVECQLIEPELLSLC